MRACRVHQRTTIANVQMGDMLQLTREQVEYVEGLVREKPPEHGRYWEVHVMDYGEFECKTVRLELTVMSNGDLAWKMPEYELVKGQV